MELRQLEYFLAVYEERSFTAAAARVLVVQSAVSAAVAALERELHVALFDRSTRRTEPTDAGVEFAARARDVLAAVDAAADGVAAVAQGLSGTIRFGLMHALMPRQVSRALAAFHQEHPGVAIRPRTDPAGASALVRAVADNDLDLAAAAFDPGRVPSSVQISELSREAMMLICPSDHRLAGRRRVGLADLVEEVFVDVPSSWGSRVAAERTFRRADLGRTVDIEVNDVPTVVDLVRAGLGIALLAPSSAGSLEGVGVVRPMPTPWFHIGLVRPSGRAERPAARRLAELILQPSDH